MIGTSGGYMGGFTRRQVVIGLAAGSVGALIPVRFALGGGKDVAWLKGIDASGVPVDGGGATVLVNEPLTLRGGHFVNIKFAPAPGYFGPGPIFQAKDGTVIHENVSVNGFAGPGCKILSNKEKGNSFIAIGECSYSDNGRKSLTTLSNSVDLRLTNRLEVVDASAFKPGQYIWLGDGKFKIKKIDKNSLFLESGELPYLIGAKVFNGGYDRCMPGQSVIGDADDRNGIRIGNGGYAWNIDTSNAKITASNNAWFGLFHHSKKYYGKQLIENITSEMNGYCNIGMGFMNEGTIKNCISKNAGNNCIDVFESKSAVDVTKNVVSGAGVDGIFVGGDGQVARVYDNNVSDCRRIGILINARHNPISNVFVKNNAVKNSGMNSLTLTGVEGGVVEDNKLEGSNIRQAIFLEKRKGLELTGHLTIENNYIVNSKNGDISTNYSGYGADSNAKVTIKNTKKALVSGIE
ncbi:TPA: right-handed parallel beta-helix repeat-containing protein, partial [Klebsiella pneumoniae subsp. pneumoniae]|nr:right-handed parallel beta-helix repeat-containing protein [Klebsiella pneumoniae subsp. pneumoniae]